MAGGGGGPAGGGSVGAGPRGPVGGRGPEARAGIGMGVSPSFRPSLSPSASVLSGRGERLSPTFGLKAPLMELGRPATERKAAVSFPRSETGPAGIRIPSGLSFARDKLSLPNYEALKPTADHEGYHIMSGIITNSDVTGFSLKPMKMADGSIALGRTSIRATPDAFNVIAGGGAAGDNPSGFHHDLKQINDRNPFDVVPSVATADFIIRDIFPKKVRDELSDHLIMRVEMDGREAIHGMVDQIFQKYAQENKDWAAYQRFKDFVALGHWRSVLAKERGKHAKKQNLSINYFKDRTEFNYDNRRIIKVENRCRLCGGPPGSHAPSCPLVTKDTMVANNSRVHNPLIDQMTDHSLGPIRVGDRPVNLNNLL